METISIPKTTLLRILKEDLNLRKVNGCLVPHLLTDEQKKIRV
jgi:hypothetical protein